MGGVVIIASAVARGYFLAQLVTLTAPTASALLLLFLFVGMGAGRLPRRLHQDHQAAQPRPAQQGKMVGQTVVALVFAVLALSHVLEDGRGITPGRRTHISFIRDSDGSRCRRSWSHAAHLG